MRTNHLIKYFLILLCTTSINSHVLGQLSVSFTTEWNTNCNGSECDYEGPGILINEIMMSPTFGDGSLWGGTASQGGEWIELYNPNICEPVDISCYYLGNNATDVVVFQNLPFPGGYVIPPGTIVPPAGFVLIRGFNAPAVPPSELIENGGNTIELVVNAPNVCVGGGSRLWFPNAGGWFAFYDSTGEPQDAVTWGNQSNLNQFPCTPDFAGCTPGVTLSNYLTIPDDRKNVILAGSPASYQGQSIRRMPDGGTWSGPAVPTLGICNSTCIDPGISTCNGSATAVVSGGSEPYSFQWNDAQAQTAATAIELCAQEYCVIITDGDGNQIEACVEVESPFYESSTEETICQGESYTLPDGSTATASGEYVSMLTSLAGCDSMVTSVVAVAPVYSFVLDAQICQYSSYELPNGTEVNEQGVYHVDFETTVGCDSVFTVNLTVDPFITVTAEFTYCEGDVHLFPDGTSTSESGEFVIQVEGTSCDTIHEQTVVFLPSYYQTEEVEICNGQTHQLPDGSNAETSGSYFTALQAITGCDSIIETVVHVHDLPETIIQMDENYCFQPGYVEVDVLPNGGVFTIGSTEMDLDSPWMNFLPPGTFTVNYSYSDNEGCSNVASTQFTILPPVAPDFVFAEGCFNTVSFTNLTSSEQDAYQWEWHLNDTLFSEEYAPEFEYNMGGVYEFSLSAIDSGNCRYSSVQEVELETGMKLSDFWLPDVITPNGDGINEHFLLMPESENCLRYSLTIFNRWGKMVFETTETGAPFAGVDIKGNDLAEGVYFYFLESTDIDCGNPQYQNLCKGSVHVFR